MGSRAAGVDGKGKILRDIGGDDISKDRKEVTIRRRPQTAALVGPRLLFLSASQGPPCYRRRYCR
jgi:hypothetical protein